MIVCGILIGIAAIALVFYLIEKIKSYSLKSVLIKTFISVLFVAVAIYNTVVKTEFYKILIIVGLVFGLSGDIFLDLKDVYPNHKKVFMNLGFIVFGVGHLFFIPAMYVFVAPGADFWKSLLPTLVISIGISACIVWVISKFLKLDFGEMKIMSFLYSICLFSTPLTALFMLIFFSHEMFIVFMMIGGILFAISDLVLSQTYFKEGHEKPLDFILNYLFYYSAQFVIAMSLFF